MTAPPNAASDASDYATKCRNALASLTEEHLRDIVKNFRGLDNVLADVAETMLDEVP